MITYSKSKATKDSKEYNRKNGTIFVSFSKAAYIPKNEERSFGVTYLFLQ